MNRKFGSLSSSTNPEQLSATVSGAILAFSSIIIMIAGLLGIPLADGAVANFAKEAGIAIGSLWFIFGVVRKAVVAIHARFS